MDGTPQMEWKDIFGHQFTEKLIFILQAMTISRKTTHIIHQNHSKEVVCIYPAKFLGFWTRNENFPNFKF